jgi:uncharacterized protein (DUF2336 family)
LRYVRAFVTAGAGLAAAPVWQQCLLISDESVDATQSIYDKASGTSTADIVTEPGEPNDAEAEAEVKAMKAKGEISPRTLAAMLRNRETTRFLIALGVLADIDFHTARLILERKELDALAIVCKAADFDRSLFLTFTVLILDRADDAMAQLLALAAQVAHADVPVLITSGLADDELKQQLAALGAGLVEKPFSADELGASIRRARAN